ncbi:MAG: Glu-tRNA(Gln) amidotransferase subunit GatD [Candidatus Micrarchaeota archaeon]
MYSAKALKELGKRGIREGDRIGLVAFGKQLEGTLMPRIEAGDADVLIVKLDSGYNAGVSVDSCQSIRKVSNKQETETKVPRLEFDASKPKVAVVATGGTISTRVDYRTGGVFMTLDPRDILATAPELASFANIAAIDSPFRIASEDMAPKEWGEIARTVAKRLDEGCVGAVITHGTDILHYTAAALSFMLTNLGKPVAVVGAQRSPDRASFDGRLNLVCAARYAVSGIPRVAVVMHGSSSDDYCYAHPGTKVRKMHTSRRDAFQTINSRPLAKIWADGKLERLADVSEGHAGKMMVDDRFEDKVAIVKPFPGADPGIVDYFTERKYKGIIVEATGLGHVPTETLDKKMSWIPAVKRAVDGGVFVGVTSQCVYGRVNPFVYRNLRLLAATGAVHLEDMLTETAFVKLGCALGREKKREKVMAFMLANVAGEYGDRITQDLFGV